MPKYMTKQRKALLAFLEQHADEELSAKIIESELGGMGVSISAVYRNLSDLEKEGKVRRVSKSGSREVYYLYTDAHKCRECLHLSCKKCGKTYHMNAECADMLINTLAQSDDFTIDKSETVLYGVCKDCKNN
ncbi:MAG: transcriptional repressor [Oscillospiraceae bacterium]|nr:transcriptional repressor [Oscillospiraceae bacterium]